MDGVEILLHIVSAIISKVTMYNENENIYYQLVKYLTILNGSVNNFL